MTETKKYLDKMEWQPEVIYYVKAISRNPKFKPRTWSHEGKYGEFWTTDVMVARYNTIDKKYTEIGEYQFMIAKSILNEVQHKVDVDMPFYLRKSAGFNKEGTTITKYNIYNTPEEITDIQQDVPFDDDMGDDAVAFKEDIKEKPEHEFQTISPIDYQQKIIGTLQDIKTNLGELVWCFKEMLDKFTVKIKKVKE